jgi:hypothetical protein
MEENSMSKAVAERPGGGPLARAGKVARGLEDIGQEDLLIPKIILLQFNSKLVKNEKGKAGHYINGTTMKNLGAAFEFVPVKVTKYVDMLKPEGSRMVFESRTYDLNDPRLKNRQFFPKDGKKADATTVMSFLCLIEGQPAIIGFKATSYNAGKKLVSQAKLDGGDLFSQKYRLTVKSDTKQGETYFVMDVEKVGPTPEAEYIQAEQVYEHLSGRMQELEKPGEEEPAGEHLEGETEKKSEPAATSEKSDAGAAALEEKPEFAPVRVLKDPRSDADYACPACGKKRGLKEGKLKTIDPESGKPWGKVRALICQPCNKLEVIEKLAE